MITVFAGAHRAAGDRRGTAADRALDDPGDVFFLDFTEIADAATGVDVRHACARRRDEYGPNCAAGTSRGYCSRTEPNPRRSAAHANIAEPVTLTGTPASAGVVTDRPGSCSILRRLG